jgi:hypothetical protein
MLMRGLQPAIMCESERVRGVSGVSGSMCAIVGISEVVIVVFAVETDKRLVTREGTCWVWNYQP